MLRPDRQKLAEQLTEIKRRRGERLGPLIAAEQKAEEIVHHHEASLREFESLDDELHAFHREQIERQVSSGEAPSLLLPADLRLKREQRDAAVGYLHEARSYRDRVRAERMQAETDVESLKVPIAEEVISIFKNEVSTRLDLYFEAHREMQRRWADVAGALRVKLTRWNGQAWEHYHFTDLEEAQMAKMYGGGIAQGRVPPQVATRLAASETAYTLFRDELYRDAGAELRLD